MELSATTTTLLTMSKTLNSTCISRLHCHFSSTRPTQRLHIQLRRLFNAEFKSPKPFNSISYSSNSLRCLCAAVSVPPIRSRLQCVDSSAASFASAAGGGCGGGIRGSGGGGGGDGASDSGEAKSNSVVGGSEDVSALSPDVIILDVGGMTCGGCAASVKRILESQVSGICDIAILTV
ncbi:hypothetical protein CsSME_00010027 [Camellia sinensis var. sinensis]